MTIQRNGGFKSTNAGPKESKLASPVNFKVKFLWWPQQSDCDSETTSIIVKALGYDDAIKTAKRILKKQKQWQQVIAIYGVDFICDRWGRAI